MHARVSRPVKGKFFSDGSRRLWLALADRDWNQEQIAEALGTKSGHTAAWFYGTRRPGLAWALRIRDVLGIPIESWVDTTSRAVVRFIIPGRKAA